jgi:hypothetical protein
MIAKAIYFVSLLAQLLWRLRDRNLLLKVSDAGFFREALACEVEPAGRQAQNSRRFLNYGIILHLALRTIQALLKVSPPKTKMS